VWALGKIYVLAEINTGRQARLSRWRFAEQLGAGDASQGRLEGLLAPQGFRRKPAEGRATPQGGISGGRGGGRTTLE